MSIFKTRIFKFGIGLLFLVLFVYIFANKYVQSKVENLLSEKLPPQFELEYKSLSIDILSGSVNLYEVLLQIKNANLDSIKSVFNMESVQLSGLGISALIQGEQIELNRLEISKPIGYYTPTLIVKDSIASEAKQPNPLKGIRIENLEIKEASITLRDKKTDSSKLIIGNAELTISELSLDLQTGPKPTIYFEDYEVDLGSLFVQASEFDELEIDVISGNKEQTTLEGIAFRTIPSPQELSKMIPKERDHYELLIDQMSLRELGLFEPESDYSLSAGFIDIAGLDLAIYRDKLPADDFSYKPTVNEMIRNIPWPFRVDSMSIAPKKINYQERVVAANQGGQLFFADGHIAIQNLSNQLPETEDTEISIQSRFMGKADIEALWTFNSNNPEDSFRFSGNCKNVQLDALNAFCQPNLNTLMAGELKTLFFDFSGDNNQSLAKVKVRFKDVEIAVLKKKDGRRNKFFSSMANFIVRNNSDNKNGVYKEEQVTVTRDKTKSQFNFLYLNLKESMMRAFL